MKRNYLGKITPISILLAGSLLSASGNPFIPVDKSVVTLQATMPLASEPGDNPAVFTFSRFGETNEPVTIAFNIGGTAKNGVDYAAITNAVVLPAGQTSTNVVITPILEPTATGYKTVVLTLPRHEAGYFIGSLSRAVAYIAYNYTNVPPTVSLVSPTNGSSYLSMPNIPLAATAFDSNGWIATVEFLANGRTLGLISNGSPGLTMLESRGSFHPVWVGGGNQHYQFVWTNVPPGNYSLTAVATDNAGLQTTSSAVDLTVTTNLPAPAVRIVSPPEAAEFPDAAPINIYAAATEMGGVIDSVEFLGNGTNLGVVTNYLATAPAGQFQLRMQWIPYSFRWTNAPVGSNVLTAIATDNNGLQATSAPVNIVVSTNAYHVRRWH